MGLGRRQGVKKDSFQRNREVRREDVGEERRRSAPQVQLHCISSGKELSNGTELSRREAPHMPPVLVCPTALRPRDLLSVPPPPFLLPLSLVVPLTSHPLKPESRNRPF